MELVKKNHQSGCQTSQLGDIILYFAMDFHQDSSIHLIARTSAAIGASTMSLTPNHLLWTYNIKRTICKANVSQQCYVNMHEFVNTCYWVWGQNLILINRAMVSLYRRILTEVSRTPHCIWSVLMTSVKILPYRPTKLS